MSWRDPEWRYFTAAESREPGYLKQRFEKYRQELQEKTEQEKKDAEEKALKVRKIGGGK